MLTKNETKQEKRALLRDPPNPLSCPVGTFKFRLYSFHISLQLDGSSESTCGIVQLIATR